MPQLQIDNYTFDYPDFMSDNGAYIAASKYARIMPDGHKESSWLEICTRVASAVFPNSRDGAKARQLADDLYNQRVAFNSPVWFNFGHRPNPQGSACFILRVDDSMESIIKWWGDSCRIFRGGSGMGADLSRIREKGAYISGGGIASGPLSFAQVADEIGKCTKSGGITRRAATMLTMKDSHPDVIDFVIQKQNVEKVLHDLKESGYDAHSVNSDIYNIITAQQANRSIRVSDALLDAAKSDSLWPLISPSTSNVIRTVPARTLLRTVAECAWSSADPGVQYENVIQDWHTLPGTDRINSSNPCSEYMSIDNSSCNLASINLLKFYDPVSDTFDVDGFKSIIRRTVVAMDNIVSLSSYPTEEIAENSKLYRQLGLGFTNLGGLLMAMGIPYDSDRGRAVAAALMAMITGEGYYQSSRLAVRGSYMDVNDTNAEATWRVLNKHADSMDYVYSLLCDYGAPTNKEYRRVFNTLAGELFETMEQLRDIVRERKNVRNSQISVIAPTGTISFVMDASTTGIEPAFSVVYEKELVADKRRLLVPIRTAEIALSRLGYSQEEINRIRFSATNRRSFSGLVKPEHEPVFQTAVDPYGNYISPKAHLLMMAFVQPFVSGAISKTINCPSHTTVDEMEYLIKYGRELNLKALAFYRDSSKAAQPHIVSQETPICNGCGLQTVPSGTCYVCPSCGESSGVCS